jgi:hypothetical protein
MGISGSALARDHLRPRRFARPRGTFDGVPFFMLFFLATITTLAAIGVRVIWLWRVRGRRQSWRY